MSYRSYRRASQAVGSQIEEAEADIGAKMALSIVGRTVAGTFFGDTGHMHVQLKDSEVWHGVVIINHHRVGFLYHRGVASASP